MDAQFLQNLRYKLQKRVRRLNSVDPSQFHIALTHFWAFIDSTPSLSGIAVQLKREQPDARESADKLLGGESVFGRTERETAAIGQEVLRKLALAPDLNTLFRLGIQLSLKAPDDLNAAVELIRDAYLESFYEYLDEALDDQRAMLALLFRYKQRSEWFHRERLWELQRRDSGNAERALAHDLYAYLHDQGLSFHIEPSSITGRIDLIAAQDTDDPLLLDAKIFDGDSRSRAYVCKGFQQIYTYTQQHNESFGYLMLFKTTDRDLQFDMSLSGLDVPTVVFNHKTLFLLTVDLFPHAKPVSQRDPLRVIRITEEDLIRPVPEASEATPPQVPPGSRS